MKEKVLEKEWFFKTSADKASVDRLVIELNGIHPVFANILVNRGINDKSKAELFFRPLLSHLHNPWSMLGMKNAVDRILDARMRKEKVMIFGDYDVDGTTSAALIYKFFGEIGLESEYYIPDRYKEGYGISLQSIDRAREGGITLFISLDCGIKAIRQVEYANERKIDVIICDHHNPGSELPAAFAILDPKQNNCKYPFNELSGCGLAFKLVQAICERLDIDKNFPNEYLDLVATSIAADIVPMVGENRILEKFGLDCINKNPSPGISAIKKATGLQKNFDISDVVFKIAPRINSAGRMSSGRKAVDILVSENEEVAFELAQEINNFNAERSDTDKQITAEAIAKIKSDSLFENRCTTVLYDPEWHKGVIGIVASRVMEYYYRPTIIFTRSNGKLSGSARSVRNFDLYNALEQCSELLIQFGGHKYAAGMTMEEENFLAFQDEFDRVVTSLINPDSLRPGIEIESKIKLTEINRSFYNVLKHFSPFGPGNMNPIFYSENVLMSRMRVLGKEGDHLKLVIFDPEKESHKLTAIGFYLGYLRDEFVEGRPFELVYTIEENVWNGIVEIQLNIKDVRF